jgi:hypothetical protein
LRIRIHFQAESNVAVLYRGLTASKGPYRSEFVMTEDKIKSTADRIIDLEAELEAPGHAALEDAAVVKAREVLHRWVDAMVGVVVNPALGRVTVIHEGGSASSVASADLAFQMSSAGIFRTG